MSNYLAIAAATATLRNLLMNVDTGITADPILADTQITTKPLDKAHSSDDVNQLNIFLYHTAPNGSLRNMDMLDRTKPGELSQFPVAVNLYYLITAFGRGNEDLMAHRLLGRAMSVLNDYPVLSREEIKAALPGNDLYRQPEHVRITPQNLSVEEMFRLWATFQTAYRISVVYELAVVMIETTLPISAPLPVLSPGGWAVPESGPPMPTLTGIAPPGLQPSALPGDLVTLSGYHIDGDSATVLLAGPAIDGTIELPTQPGGTSTMRMVTLPGVGAGSVNWQAGLYTLAVRVQQRGDQPRTTNALPLAIAPSISVIVQNPVARDNAGGATLVIRSGIPVEADQRAVLIVSDREVQSSARTNTTNELSFTLSDAIPGEYYVRLRVDGIDSHLVNRGANPPTYDPAAKVTIL